MKTTIKLLHKIFCSGVSFKRYTPILDAHTDLFEALENSLSKEDRELIKLESTDTHQACVDFESRAGFVINRYGTGLNKKNILFFTWDEDENAKPIMTNSGFFKVENGYVVKPILCNGVKIKAAETNETMKESCTAFTECLHNWFMRIVDYLMSNKEPFSRNSMLKIYQEEILPNAKNIIANRKSPSAFCGQLFINGFIHYDRSVLVIAGENSVPIKEDEVNRTETSQVDEEVKKVYLREVHLKINELAKDLTKLIEKYNSGPSRRFSALWTKIDIDNRKMEPVLFKISNKGFKYMKIVFDSTKFASYSFRIKNTQIDIRVNDDNVILRWNPSIKDINEREKVKDEIMTTAIALIRLLNIRSKF